jgi:hypothetical protein
MSEIPASERERTSNQARSGVVDGEEEEEEGRNNFAADRFASQEEMSEIPANEREKEKASDRVRSRVVDREEEEGRNNFAADRFASQDCEKIFKTILRKNLKKYS